MYLLVTHGLPSVSGDVAVVLVSIPAEPRAHPLVVGLWGSLGSWDWSIGVGGSGGHSRSLRRKLFTLGLKDFNSLTSSPAIPVVSAEPSPRVGTHLSSGFFYFPGMASVGCET